MITVTTHDSPISITVYLALMNEKETILSSYKISPPWTHVLQKFFPHLKQDPASKGFNFCWHPFTVLQEVTFCMVVIYRLDTN